jgi:hypothetical protein
MAKQYYFMYANHRYEIVARGFSTAKEADDYGRKRYGGFAQYKKLADGKYVLGVRRTPMHSRRR